MVSKRLTSGVCLFVGLLNRHPKLWCYGDGEGGRLMSSLTLRCKHIAFRYVIKNRSVKLMWHSKREKGTDKAQIMSQADERWSDLYMCDSVLGTHI